MSSLVENVVAAFAPVLQYSAYGTSAPSDSFPKINLPFLYGLLYSTSKVVLPELKTTLALGLEGNNIPYEKNATTAINKARNVYLIYFIIFSFKDIQNFI